MLAARLGHEASLFFWPGLIDGSDGFGGKPLLDPLTGVLFASGMLISLWRWREERHFILIVGVLIGLLSSALTIGAEYRRMIVVLPFAMAAAGFSLDFLWRKIAASSASLVKVRTIGLAGVVVLALGYAGFSNTSYYFTELVRRPSTVWVFSADLVKATEYLGSLGESTSSTILEADGPTTMRRGGFSSRGWQEKTGQGSSEVSVWKGPKKALWCASSSRRMTSMRTKSGGLIREGSSSSTGKMGGDILTRTTLGKMGFGESIRAYLNVELNR